MTENRLKKTNYESPLTEAIDILPEGVMCDSGLNSGGEGMGPGGCGGLD